MAGCRITALVLTAVPTLRAQGVGSFVENDGAQHFLFVDANQHIQQILYNGAFSVGDLTSASGAPLAAAGTGLSGFVDPSGTPTFCLC